MIVADAAVTDAVAGASDADAGDVDRLIMCCCFVWIDVVADSCVDRVLTELRCSLSH